MSELKKKPFFKRPLFILAAGMSLGIIIMLLADQAMKWSSTPEFCAICHVHPHVDDSWKKGVHYNTGSGYRVTCVECHLPPKGSLNHIKEKARTGLHDLWAYMTKDSADFDWDAKSQLEYAVKIVSNESCMKCHPNLFPKTLSDDGGTAHLYYEQNYKALDLQCISCHLDAGHYDPNYVHERITTIGVADEDANKALFTEATPLTGFANFTEQIPGTPVSFNMVAVKGGEFQMGSPADEPFRKDDEGPVRTVSVTDFYMGEVEVTWREYWSFFRETMSEGRKDGAELMANNLVAETADAVSGPTPPFGNPEQGWGAGSRPAITMSHYAAQTYCLWLSKKTGKNYRLPTEAEWEYAARGGTSTPYFFEGNPKKFSDQGFWRKFISADTAVINSYIVYTKNARNRTQEPSAVMPNPFGLKNMLGNVMEYCLDWYAPDAYAQTEATVSNPRGPAEGTEHVVRGGDYTRDASEVRAASREFTQTEQWLKTDPQVPKSIWWLSDIKGVGFRVVCVPGESPAQPTSESATAGEGNTVPESGTETYQ